VDIKVLVALHKPYELPRDSMYLPVWVGAALADEGKESVAGMAGESSDTTGKTVLLSYQRDDEGENISSKNAGYSELTALYWGWKNLSCDYMGLVHYRRHFAGKAKADNVFDRVLSRDEAERLLQKGDLIVPKKRHYYIESLYTHYSHTLDGRHLDVAREIVERDCPEYLPYVVAAYTDTKGYMFNMFLMKKEDIDDYCNFLFPVLFALEEELTARGITRDLSAFSARVYGRVSEILFNAWLRKRMAEGLRPVEAPCLNMEPVNWLKKGSAFLAAKFFGKKYEASF